ncbi:MAG: nucleotidyltransferase domain-containing protein [Nitrospirae bacterium]|nr:nucleotidyltransferase domain-containing protein [Magnetococcales bacterium]
MTDVTQKLLTQAIRIIVEVADPEQVILFGSHARGEARTDSDFDLLVVESAPFGPERSRYREMARLERAMVRFPVAIIFWSTAGRKLSDFGAQPAIWSTKPCKEGKVLYARP